MCECCQLDVCYPTPWNLAPDLITVTLLLRNKGGAAGGGGSLLVARCLANGMITLEETKPMANGKFLASRGKYRNES